MPGDPSMCPDNPTLEIAYDDAGNPFYRDGNGRWVPHPGVAEVVTGRLSASAVTMAPFAGHWHREFPSRSLSNGVSGAPTTAQQDYLPTSTGTFSRPSSHPSSSRIPLREPVAHQYMFDPALVPLPETPDDNLTDGPSIAKAQGRIPATKVAGSRRKGKERACADERIHRKGKENAVAAQKKWNVDTEDSKRGTKRKAPLDAEDKKPSKRGRPSGAGNYSHDDVMALLAFVEKELPIGQRGWQTVHTHYIKRARTHERPERSLKSLETKFKQLVKTTKPTGDAECPPEVERAHEVDYLINEKAGTRDLDDEEFADEVSDSPTHYSISSDDEPSPPPSTQPKVAVARPARTIVPMPRRNARGTNGLDLVSKIAHVFDPEAQTQRDRERSERSFQNTHFLAISQQLRDALTTIEALRSQLIQAQQRTHDADRARDRAELKLEIVSIAGATALPRVSGRSTTRGQRTHIRNSPKKKHRCEEVCADGGGKVWWVTDEEDMSDFAEDAEAPSSSRQPLRSNLPSRPPSPFHSVTWCHDNADPAGQEGSSSSLGPPFTQAMTPVVAVKQSKEQDKDEVALCSQWSVTSRSP